MFEKKEAWMLLIRVSAYGWPDLVRGATISNPEGVGNLASEFAMSVDTKNRD